MQSAELGVGVADRWQGPPTRDRQFISEVGKDNLRLILEFQGRQSLI
jgi:hypothetical protein